MTSIESRTGSGWRDLLGPRYLRTVTVLAGGVALYATNEFLTNSLLPSAVAEIGGQRLYVWVTTVYLVASVAAATTVGAVLARLGPRWAYVSALAVFSGASLGCAVAPSMELLLIGRTVQGAAGGLIAGLGYAVINSALPRSSWTKASAVVSAMWGVGTLVGPATGGLFAQFVSWRWAFAFVTVVAAGLVALVPFALPARTGGASVERHRIPVWSLLLLGGAALVINVAGIVRNVAWTVGLGLAGVVLVVSFVFADRRTAAGVLPPTTFRPGPLKWIYVTLGLLMAANMANTYTPLFGQRLAHLAPVAAGFLGAALAIGWSVGEIASASVTSERAPARIVAVAPVVMAVGLSTVAVSLVDDTPSAIVALWVAALVLSGVGIGMAWPHLSAWAMGSVDDPSEGGRAAAAINTVQLICGAVGAGVAGVVVNAVGAGDAHAARSLFGVFATLALATSVAAVRAGRRQSRSSSS